MQACQEGSRPVQVIHIREGYTALDASNRDAMGAHGRYTTPRTTEVELTPFLRQRTRALYLEQSCIASELLPTLTDDKLTLLLSVDQRRLDAHIRFGLAQPPAVHCPARVESGQLGRSASVPIPKRQRTPLGRIPPRGSS